MKYNKRCELCKWAIIPELEDGSDFDMDASLRCSNPLNNHSRNINNGSNRLTSMDTDLTLSYISFEVDDNDLCGAFDMSKQMMDDIKNGCIS